MVAPAVVALPTTDIQVNVSGPASAAAGAGFTYVVTIGNSSLTPAGGASLANSLPDGATGVSATCQAESGAVCPASLVVSDTAVTGVIAALPHLGLLTITINGNFGVPSASSVTNAAHVDPPSGIADSDLSSNDSAVSTAIGPAEADLQLTWSQAAPTLSADTPNTYTVTVANKGPSAADGASFINAFQLYDQAVHLYSGMDVEVTTCAGVGGVECPSFIRSESEVYQVYWNGSFGAFPAGATLTVIYRVTPIDRAEPPCGTGTGGLFHRLILNPPTGITDPQPGDNDLSPDVTAAPDPQPCPVSDLAVTWSQANPTISADAPNTYTVTVTNKGPRAADGASFFDYLQMGDGGARLYPTIDVDVLSCDGVGGVACPSFITDATGVSQLIWSGTFDAFPVGAVLTVVYRVDPVPSGVPVCGSGSGGLSSRVIVGTPSGLSDPQSNDNDLSEYSPTPALQPCPETDLAVTWTAANPVITPDLPNTYTVTVTNKGPLAADGAPFFNNVSAYDSAAQLYPTLDVDVLSCDGVGGVECPSFIADAPGVSQLVWNGSFGAFPSGAVLTLVYRVTPIPGQDAVCGDGSGGLYHRLIISTPTGLTDSQSNDNDLSEGTGTPCHDISVNQMVSPDPAAAGDAVTLTTTVTNTREGDLHGVLFSDTLPSGFNFGEAVCEPDDGSVCGEVSYDPGSRTVSSVITTLSGPVTFTVTGTAGRIPGSYPSTATAISAVGADAFYDPVPESNSSTVSLQVNNTSSSIAVTKELTGLAAGAPTALTFTGQVVCGDQPAHLWSITLPAGAASGSAPAARFYDGDACTITEDDAPALPTGYSYPGATVIEPAVIEALGVSLSVDVTSTSAVLAPTSPTSTTSPTATAIPSTTSPTSSSGSTSPDGSSGPSSAIGAGRPEVTDSVGRPGLASTGGPTAALAAIGLLMACGGLTSLRLARGRRRGRHA